jgi:hypothetical protein
MENSTFLFANPRAIHGAGSVMDMGGTMSDYNFSRTPVEADVIATRLDWKAVGDDIRSAMAHAAKMRRAAPPRRRSRRGRTRR